MLLISILEVPKFSIKFIQRVLVVSNGSMSILNSVHADSSLIIFLSDYILHGVNTLVIVFKVGVKDINLFSKHVKILILFILTVLKLYDLSVILMIDFLLISYKLIKMFILLTII